MYAVGKDGYVKTKFISYSPTIIIPNVSYYIEGEVLGRMLDDLSVTFDLDEVIDTSPMSVLDLFNLLEPSLGTDLQRYAKFWTDMIPYEDYSDVDYLAEPSCVANFDEEKIWNALFFEPTEPSYFYSRVEIYMSKGKINARALDPIPKGSKCPVWGTLVKGSYLGQRDFLPLRIYDPWNGEPFPCIYMDYFIHLDSNIDWTGSLFSDGTDANMVLTQSYDKLSYVTTRNIEVGEILVVDLTYPDTGSLELLKRSRMMIKQAKKRM